MQFKNVAVLSTAGVIAALALGAGGAYAANQIGSAGITNDSVRSIDVKDQTLRVRDLRPGAVTRLQGKGTDTSALEARIAELEANAANGSDINTNWANGLGATIVDANTVELDSRNDDGYAFASIDNLDLPISEGAEIEFTYRLDNGAAFGWGAPRIQFYVNGVKYSSAHQVTPELGTENGDGTFTVKAVATSVKDNSATKNPDGTVKRASLVYDYEAKGTVTFTNVVIDGQPISFK